MRGEALAEQTKADDEIGVDKIGPALADSGGDAPRQEFGVALDIGDQREHLLWRVRQHALLGMGGHGARLASQKLWDRSQFHSDP